MVSAQLLEKDRAKIPKKVLIFCWYRGILLYNVRIVQWCTFKAGARQGKGKGWKYPSVFTFSHFSCPSVVLLRRVQGKARERGWRTWGGFMGCGPPAAEMFPLHCTSALHRTTWLYVCTAQDHMTLRLHCTEPHDHTTQHRTTWPHSTAKHKTTPHDHTEQHSTTWLYIWIAQQAMHCHLRLCNARKAQCYKCWQRKI